MYKENTLWKQLSRLKNLELSKYLDKDSAPVTVDNFVTLANKGFYNGLTFHRIIVDSWSGMAVLKVMAQVVRAIPLKANSKLMESATNKTY